MGLGQGCCAAWPRTFRRVERSSLRFSSLRAKLAALPAAVALYCPRKVISWSPSRVSNWFRTLAAICHATPGHATRLGAGQLVVGGEGGGEGSGGSGGSGEGRG